MGDSESDSIDFLAKYKDWEAVKRMNINSNTKPEEVAFHLASIRQTIDKKAFEILGIDTKQLDKIAENLADKKPSNYKSLAETIEDLSKKEIREAVEKSCNDKPELGSVANAYLLRVIFQNLGFEFCLDQKIIDEIYTNAVKKSKEEEANINKNSIDFLAKYKDWISIKKMSIVDNIKPEEVAFHLASIRQTIDKKAFEILGIDTKQLDQFVENLTEGKRKTYKTMAEIIGNLDNNATKEVIKKASNSKPELEQVARVYILRKVVQNLGFDFDVNQEMLAKVYSYLKIPKPLGRKPKA
ncbi:MAG: DUF2666 family protein [Candidatus Micrarchaeia archaeon]